VSDLVLQIQQGFGVLLAISLPLVLAAAVGSLVATLLVGLLGTQDSTLSLVARTLAVVLALVLVARSAADETVALTRSLWSGLDEVGRGR
jgi:flagellar biosynthesis protein FliQ